MHRYFLSYAFDLNESINFDNNDYFEQTFYLNNIEHFFNLWRTNSQLGVRYNRFTYTLEDSVIYNESRSFLADVQSVLPLGDNWHWKEEYHFMNKTFDKVSEQDANYIQHQVTTDL